jgi:hypothetical protein
MAASVMVVMPRMRDPADVARVHALATWRLGKAIYRLDPTFADALVETELGGWSAGCIRSWSRLVGIQTSSSRLSTSRGPARTAHSDVRLR